MEDPQYLAPQELEAGLDWIRQSPADGGLLELIVRRPAVDRREILAEGQLDPQTGLVGDNWALRASAMTPDRSPHPDMQLTLMNTRVIALLARTKERWPLAGDQLFVDLDLSLANLPPGTRLQIGQAVLEITAQPHTGCQKFAERFGPAARAFINAPANKGLRLRGINARVLQGGLIHAGDTVRKMG